MSKNQQNNQNKCPNQSSNKNPQGSQNRKNQPNAD